MFNFPSFPLKTFEIFGFLKFLGGMETEHWSENSSQKVRYWKRFWEKLKNIFAKEVELSTKISIK